MCRGPSFIPWVGEWWGEGQVLVRGHRVTSAPPVLPLLRPLPPFLAVVLWLLPRLSQCSESEWELAAFMAVLGPRWPTGARGRKLPIGQLGSACTS